MYSLGIVLLELVEAFKTDMEKVQNITQLRKGHISQYLLTQHPNFANIIQQLVVKNPEDRPDAKTLLQSLTTKVVESDQIKSLKCELAKKDEEINRLKELLKKAGVENV